MNCIRQASAGQASQQPHAPHRTALHWSIGFHRRGLSRRGFTRYGEHAELVGQTSRAARKRARETGCTWKALEATTDEGSMIQGSQGHHSSKVWRWRGGSGALTGWLCCFEASTKAASAQSTMVVDGPCRFIQFLPIRIAGRWIRSTLPSAICVL